MHQYDSLTSGFLSPEDDLYPKIIVLEQGMPFASFQSKAVVFESPPSCTQPKQTVAKPRGTRERHGAEKNGGSSGHGSSAKVLRRWKKMCNKIHPFSWTGNYRVNKTRIPDTIDSDTATGVIVTRRFSLLIIDPLDTNSSDWINAG